MFKASLDWNDGIGKHLVAIIGIGVVSFIILLAIESSALKCIKSVLRIYPYFDPESTDNDDDDDVRAEKCRIAKMPLDELKSKMMSIVMKNVSKFYGKFCAVDKFSVSIKR